MSTTTTTRAARRISSAHSWRARRKALMMVALLSAISAPAQAQFATGGGGRFLDRILWFDWGNPGNAIVDGATVTNSVVVGGRALNITCTIANIAGGPLDVYRPGGWRGDGLDDLYNIGGTGGSNTMDIGVRGPSRTTSSFNFSCSATRGPDQQPFPLGGLVFADAEQLGGVEYIQASISGAGTNWRIVDRTRACGESTLATLTGDASASTLLVRSTNACGGSGPMVVAYMENTTAARVQERGGGQTSVALGVLVADAADFGDAPASYGAPVHLASFSWNGGIVPYGTTINASTAPMADLVLPAARLGALLDADEAAVPSADANGDDIRDQDDEDALAEPLGIISTPPGQTYTSPPITCGGGGAVRGWIDFNRDGDFLDPGEISTDTPTCTSGVVNLTWTVPADANPGRSYLRLRTASDPGQIASPIGNATDGEVEDHLIEALAPAKLTLVKQVDSRLQASDQFTVSIVNGATVLASATTAGADTTVSTVLVPVDNDHPYLLRDANAAGGLLRYATAATCVANPGSLGAVPTPTGPAGTGPIDWSLSLNAGNDITCTLTNTPNITDLAITKRNESPSGGQVPRGQPTTYTLTVTNNGPATSTGAVVTDTPSAGLTCPAANPVTCTGPAGACPSGAVTVAQLTGAGATLGTLGNGQSLTMSFVCTVQ